MLPMPGGLALLEMGGGQLGEGGRHRWTPTLHSMSSNIFLLGPFMLIQTHEQESHVTHAHTPQKAEKEDREKTKKGGGGCLCKCVVVTVFISHLTWQCKHPFHMPMKPICIELN